MRATPKEGRRVPAWTLLRFVSPVAAIAFGIVMGTQGPAYSLESNTVKAPVIAVSAAKSDVAPVKPRAPVQVELPTPAPTKYFTGLEEALVATGPVTDEESKDLDAALKEFHEAPAKAGTEGDYSDFAKPLLGFITLHPSSNWNAALYLNIGLGYYHSGYFSKAFPTFEQAWKLGKSATHPMARLIADRAVGELAWMHGRVGHADELEQVIKDVADRPLGGAGAQALMSAKSNLWSFRNDYGSSYLCGPTALKNVLTAIKASPKQIKVVEDARSGPRGFSLTQLAQLADKTKLNYALIHREAGQPLPVPSVINWSVHHYAALTGRQENLYTVQDSTFGDGGGSLLTAKAIDAESSGYFLVPQSVMKANPKAGWRVVAANSAEAQAVYGMGTGPGSDSERTQDHDSCPSPNPSPTGPVQNSTPAFGSNLKILSANNMTVACATPMVVSLHLSDSALGYAPQKGVPSTVALFYNSRELSQPTTLSFGNVSPLWTHSWISWIWDDPTTNREGWNVRRYASGGGAWNYYNQYDRVKGTWTHPEAPDNSNTWRTPVLGVATNYQHLLPDGSKEIFTLPDGATTYPRKLFLTSVIDPQGNTTTLSYDSSFRLTSFTDAMGRATTFTYGLSGYPLLVTQITDPFGRTVQLTYDTSLRLASITDPIGITSSFTYSTTQPSFVTNLTTPYGTSTYNNIPNPNDAAASNTRSLTLTDPMGYTDFYYFYQSGTSSPSGDPVGAPTGMSTDNNGWLQWRNTYHWDPHQFALGATMTSGQVTAEDFTKSDIFHWFHNWYNVQANQTYVSGELASFKPPLEHRIWYNYPASVFYAEGTFDRPTIVGRIMDNGASQESKATYTANTTNINQPTSVTDPLGRSTKYTYDTNNIDLLTVQQLTASPSTYTTIGTYGSYTTGHRPQTYTDAAGQVWNYTYTAAGQIKTVTDPNSGVTTYNYDGSGRLSNIVNANSQTVLTLTYDSADRTRTTTDSEGYVLTYDYDNLDRVTKITYPDTTTDLYDYNFQSGSNVGTPSLDIRKYTDRLGRVTTYDYNANRWLTSVIEPISGGTTRATSYDYYENGTLKNLTDANGNVTHWDIDLESRPTAKTYAYGTASAKTETYTYETSTSRLKSITDALGQVKTFTYGLDDRVTGITYTSSVNATPNVTLAYDTYFPRMTSMADGTGTTTYGYTAIGTNGALKLSSIVGPYSNDTIGLTYDTLGRLSGRNVPGGNETFGYDAISRLTTHGTPLGNVTETYLGQTSQQASQSVINGAVTVSTGWGYDTNTNDRRLTSITNSGVSRSYSLSYLDPATSAINPYDIMSITDTAASGHPFATQTHSYTYDKVDRLLTGNQTTPGNFTYGYDKLDNATTVTNPSGTITPAPTYNVNNQLATWGSNNYVYDANGNTLSGDGTKTYKWDAENRLLEIDYIGTSNKTVFTYNGNGQRRATSETVGGVTTTTRYLWCGVRICQSRDGSDNILRRHTREGEYNFTTGQILVYSQDQLGSVRDVLDGTTGARVASYDFSPYGAVTQSNVTNGTDYQYAGLMAHPTSGLLMAATRFYDPITGRWLNRDRLGEQGGLNLYSYSDVNPIMGIDPLGLYSETECSRFGLCDPGKNNFTPDPFQWSDLMFPVNLALFCIPGERFGQFIGDEFGGARIGDWTRREKNLFKKQNSELNGGVNKCESCGRELKSIGNKKGEPTPSDQLQIHHDPEIQNGGGRHSDHNILCPGCHKEIHYGQ